MKKKKAVGWLVAWGVLLILGSICSGIYKITCYFQNAVILMTPPYENDAFFLIFLFAILLLILLLCVSCYYAIKESNKGIKIATICLIVPHVLCMAVMLAQKFHLF